MASNPFIKLPREMRDKIYEMVFEYESNRPNCGHSKAGIPSNYTGKCLYVQQYSRQGERPTKHVFADELLALLLVNRQISAEAAPIFFKKSVFTGTFSIRNPLISFIKGSGSCRRDMIRTVELGPYDCFHHQNPKHCIDANGLFEFLRSLKNLRTLLLWTRNMPFEEVQESLEIAGIHTILGYVNVIIEQIFPLRLQSGSHRALPGGERCISLAEYDPLWKYSQALTCADGDTDWNEKHISRKVFWKWDHESKTFIPGPIHEPLLVSRRQHGQP